VVKLGEFKQIEFRKKGTARKCTLKRGEVNKPQYFPVVFFPKLDENPFS
jgi:hypothetical protein